MIIVPIKVMVLIDGVKFFNINFYSVPVDMQQDSFVGFAIRR